jgi:hypothetical protein
MDPRERFIAEIAKGKTFIDVGGLSNVVHERISSAHEAGARELTLLDVEKPECVWWTQLRARLRERGITDCNFVSCDFIASELPQYDVVHSSGVLYHIPAPLLYLKKLHAITREHCILTSTIINERLTYDGRELQFPECSVVFLPALAGAELEIVAGWFRNAGYGNVVALKEEYSDFTNYYPNWFMPTIAAFRAMAVSAGFEIVDEAPTDPGLAHTLLLKRVGS